MINRCAHILCMKHSEHPSVFHFLQMGLRAHGVAHSFPLILTLAFPAPLVADSFRLSWIVSWGLIPCYLFWALPGWNTAIRWLDQPGSSSILQLYCLQSLTQWGNCKTIMLTYPFRHTTHCSIFEICFCSLLLVCSASTKVCSGAPRWWGSNTFQVFFQCDFDLHQGEKWKIMHTFSGDNISKVKRNPLYMGLCTGLHTQPRMTVAWCIITAGVSPALMNEL